VSKRLLKLSNVYILASPSVKDFCSILSECSVPFHAIGRRGPHLHRMDVISDRVRSTSGDEGFNTVRFSSRYFYLRLQPLLLTIPEPSRRVTSWFAGTFLYCSWSPLGQ